MRLCAWDLDGTLVDSAGDICLHVNATLVERGLPLLEHAAIRPFIGRGARALLRSVMPTASEAQVDDATRDYQQRYTQAPLVEAVLFPGATDVLRALT